MSFDFCNATKSTLWLAVAACLACATPRAAKLSDETAWSGYASWYGKDFHGKKTASGEPYDMNALTAAHRTLPFGTLVRVTAQDGKSTVVRINDRGPFVKGRVIDVSYAAAKELGLTLAGSLPVRLERVGIERPTANATLQTPEATWIQLGTFKNPDNAENFYFELKAKFPAYAFEVQQERGFHIVYCGPFEDDEKAYALHREFEQKDYENLVVRKIK